MSCNMCTSKNQIQKYGIRTHCAHRFYTVLLYTPVLYYTLTLKIAFYSLSYIDGNISFPIREAEKHFLCFGRRVQTEEHFLCLVGVEKLENVRTFR